MNILIQNATIVNEGRIFRGHVFIEQNMIVQVSEVPITRKAHLVIEAEGLHLFPGCIDDQVHFREPGLTHKGELYTEARAAVAGGITSYMEMPNTIPNTFTQELLEQKYKRASEVSLANYSFYIGASNDNIDEVLKTSPRNVCGVKVFMGSSTGNMLVDDPATLEALFSRCKMLIAVHCEDEATVRANTARYKERYGDDAPAKIHPEIRNTEACYLSSSFAVGLAKKYNTRLHILHISTAKELSLFRNDVPIREKRITSEACIHHLWFTDADYDKRGNFIKWNPAVKTEADRDAIREAVKNGTIDVIATDHAPHTKEEKLQNYFQAPSGGPLVQHALLAVLELVKQGKFRLEQVPEKMAHAVAECFSIDRRGYIREGYFADLVLVDLNAPQTVTPESLLYKCGWSPFEGVSFSSTITHTIVSGNLVYERGRFDETKKGARLQFDRPHTQQEML